jgi:hypothetical protein
MKHSILLLFHMFDEELSSFQLSWIEELQVTMKQEKSCS